MFTEITCETCENIFRKKNTEINRSNKLGRKHYCSLGCSGRGNFKNIPEDKKPDPRTINGHGRQVDELSPFRWHLKNIKWHSRNKHELCLTLEDLRRQWEKQMGICPYTGWGLINPESTSKNIKLSKTTNRASLDRIDSGKGYTIDNIQFVSLMAQYAKNEWHEEELIKFCQAVNGQFRG